MADTKPDFPWGKSAVYLVDGCDPPRPPDAFEQAVIDALEVILTDYVDGVNETTLHEKR